MHALARVQKSGDQSSTARQARRPSSTLTRGAGAARQQELHHGQLGGAVHVGAAHGGPGGVEGDEPVEEQRVLGHAARERLVPAAGDAGRVEEGCLHVSHRLLALVLARQQSALAPHMWWWVLTMPGITTSPSPSMICKGRRENAQLGSAPGTGRPGLPHWHLQPGPAPASLGAHCVCLPQVLRQVGRRAHPFNHVAPNEDGGALNVAKRRQRCDNIGVPQQRRAGRHGSRHAAPLVRHIGGGLSRGGGSGKGACKEGSGGQAAGGRRRRRRRPRKPGSETA